ncbi:MAG: PocR ligand-binding domain-containing protein [Solirubrobacteraceae bacterium]
MLLPRNAVPSFPIELERLVTPERLTGLQRTYTATLGMAASIIAPGGRRITPETNRRRICSLLCTSDELRARCHGNDLKAMEIAGPAATIYTTDCCGLVDVAIPLSVGSTKAATFLSGLVRTAPLDHQGAAAIVDCYLGRGFALPAREELEAALMSVPVVDAAVLQTSATLLSEFANHIADLAARTLLETELRETRRRAMTASRTQSFLAGSLNTLADVAILERAEDAHALVVALAKVSRYAADGRELSTIAEEVEHALDYLQVRQVGLGDLLRFEATVERALDLLTLPRLTVRALVDHLLWRHLEAGQPDRPITITARTEPHGVTIEVTVRSLPSHPTELSELADVRERLTRYHGDGASLSLSAGPGSHCVRLRVPPSHN